MTKKLHYSENKTLKLTNVLKFKIPLKQDALEYDIIIEQMQTYIKAKGAIQIGPLIQYAKADLTDAGDLNAYIVLMLQCNHYIHEVTNPYVMDSLVRVPNALYCRYHGPEDSLHFAYSKIQLEAFENDIELEKESYTIFVDQNEDDESMIADVFIPRSRES
ncbi:MAG: hypothetical protein LUE92_16725 [Clostridiales bacterium]|nr:hypothetical protein [Clostridiales bacterium]